MNEFTPIKKPRPISGEPIRRFVESVLKAKAAMKTFGESAAALGLTGEQWAEIDAMPEDSTGEEQ